MVDWSGWDGTQTARRYESMAEHGLRGVSPSYERLCLGVAADPAVIERLDTLPTPKRQPNLLLGAVRLLGGPVDAYDPFRAFLLDRWDDVSAEMRTRRTQTNEARRTATLVPALAALPQPLALLEVGASAGLCLQPDRYAYRYDGGPVIGSSDLVLDCTTSGGVPVPATVPQVSWRAGLDLNPLDVADDDDMRWLEALIWPEETERFDILRAAVAIARHHPLTVTQGDLTTDVAPLAALAPPDATLVVFHSAVLAYLDDAQRAAFREQLAQLARTRPVVWLSNEGSGVVVDVPAGAGSGNDFVIAQDGVAIARANSHGRSVSWLDADRTPGGRSMSRRPDHRSSSW